MADTSDFRNGLTLEHKNGLWSIIEFLHVKPGKGGAFVRTKLKNVRTGQVVENTFRAGEKVTEPGDLKAAIGRGLAAVRDGRPYLLDVLAERWGGVGDYTWHPEISIAGMRTRNV